MVSEKQPCEMLDVEPERLIRYVFAAGMLDATITWRLAPEGAGTRLTLRHEGFNLDTPLGRQALHEGRMAGGARPNDGGPRPQSPEGGLTVKRRAIGPQRGDRRHIRAGAP
jgi:uncharacterized protein YndB with AHSA1/START domain